MTSAVKNANIAVYDFVASIAAGSPLARSQFFDLKNGGVAISYSGWVHRRPQAEGRRISAGEDHLGRDQGPDHDQQVGVLREGPGPAGETCWVPGPSR